MIERHEEYIWATARVLEQRRFEFLFGDGDAAAVQGRARALQDRRRRLRLRARARRARPDEPAAAHLDRARGARGARARPTRAICDHIETLTAPDGGVPVALPSLEPWPRAPWWGIGDRGHAARDRAALRAAARARRTRGWTRAEAFCWARDRGDREDAPVRGRGRDHVPRRRVRPRARAARQAERLGGARARAGPRRHAARGLLARRDPPPAQLRQAPGQPRARVVQRRRDRARRSTTSSRAQRDARRLGRSRGRVWTPAIAIEWSGLMTIDALKTLSAYGRV